MIRRAFLLAAFAALVLCLACGQTVTTPPPDDEPEPVPVLFGELEFGDAATLDVVTWNLKGFPYNNLVTVGYAAAAIRAMDADVVALQEISQGGYFDLLADSLAADGYLGERATTDSFINLAYLWKSDRVTGVEISEPLRDRDIHLRYPLVMDMTFDGAAFTLINNHLKCCGDGLLSPTDTEDEEYIRAAACADMDLWIENNAPDRPVILLGDLNDLLLDPAVHNVFQVFLDDPDHYRFADLDLADASNQASWSWKLQSHLDHILVTDELFAALEREGSEVRTLRLDRLLDGGFSEYEDNLSDHFPVGVRLQVRP